ncbi:MAG: protein O-mannosyl-transferase [Verrucomicrobiota bacterium]|jgi:tetratricopeptide (TPR) repeat protein
MRQRGKNQIGRGEAAAIRLVALHDRWRLLGICVFLIAITWLVFGQTVHFDFINFDDGDYVYKNPGVTHGLTLAGIVRAFTHSHAANWHPLTWISHMLDCQLYGLSPGGHHATNVVFHAANAVLLFMILQGMTGLLWRSAFVAALFAIHPLHVESVAWVSERKDVLSGLFFMLTMWAYVRYARGPRSARRCALVLILFACGLMSKSMLVTMPFVLLLLDYWPLKRFAQPRGADGNTFKIVRQLVLEKTPLFALSLASCVVTVFAQNKALRPLAAISLPSRVGNAVVAYKDYLLQMFWPSNLAVFYPWDVARINGSNLLLSGVLILGISALVFVLRQRRYFVTGWLWYLIMLGPVIGVIQVGNQARADRYTYLPHIGLYVLLTWAAADLCMRWQHRRLFLAVLSVIILAGLAIATQIQASYWRNSESLWSEALSHTADNVIAELNLGEAVDTLGRSTEAIARFERVLQIDPNQPMVHASLGAILLKIGKTDAALAHLQKSLEIQPEQSSVHLSLGTALLEIGRLDEAVTHLRKAVEFVPDSVEAHANLGLALLQMERLDESVTHLQRALEIDPNHANAHYNLGNTLLQMGRFNEALAHYNKALEINPNDAEVLNNMAWVLATAPDASIRNGEKAVEMAQRAVSLTSNSQPRTTATLAAAFAETGRFPDAVKTAERGLQLATGQGNVALANSIRTQLGLYRSSLPFRDTRSSASR